MSDSDQLQVRSALNQAWTAVEKNDRMEARRWAVHALGIAPNNETAWLILATVACPKASVGYLQKALQINPKSDRARKGMNWALRRVQKQSNQIDPSVVIASTLETQPILPPQENSTSLPLYSQGNIKKVFPELGSSSLQPQIQVSRWKKALKSKSFMNELS